MPSDPMEQAEKLANLKLKSMSFFPAYHNHGWTNCGPGIWIQYWKTKDSKPVPVSLRTDDNTLAIWMISQWRAL